MERNDQRPTPVSYEEVVHLTEVFHTVQGEGPWVGCPAVFVRLAGCNLQCPMCDTRYDRRWTKTPEEVVGEAMDLHKAGFPLMVVTGGEPFRQPVALCHLVEYGVAAGFHVQIETNGTLWWDDEFAPPPEFGYTDLSVVVSPKENFVDSRLLAWKGQVHWKYPLHHKHVDAGDGLPTMSLANNLAGGLRVARPPAGHVPYVQPADVGKDRINALNLDAAVQSSLRFGHRLGVQLHKIVNLP